MKSLYFIVTITYFIYLLTLDASGQTVEGTTAKPGEKVEEYDSNQPYCFKFTWLGPDYDNSSIDMVNSTCEKILDEGRVSKSVPCRMPLVISNDTTPPDMDYLWRNYKMRVACRQRKGQVCAKYTYKLNNEYLNITYMCTKVITDDEGAETSGCFKQMQDGFESEMCICKATPHLGADYKPCNRAGVAAAVQSIPILLSSFVSIIYLFAK